MTKFNFNGDWEYKMNLPEFMKSNKHWYEDPDPNFKPKLINLKILDQRTLDPDPLPQQLDTIHHLINNEKKILKSLNKAFVSINKTYGEYCGEHDWYSNDRTADKLGTVFLVSEIVILTEHKDGHCYIEFSGEYKGDPEHGLIVAMHGDRLMGFDQIGEDNYKEIYEDLGPEKDAFRDFNIKTNEFGINQIHATIEKYDKLKPWQLETSEEQFRRLLRCNKTEEIIHEIESKNWKINTRFSDMGQNIVDMAAVQGNQELLEYLIDKEGDFSNSIPACIQHASSNKEMIKYLVNKGASIDTWLFWGTTPLCEEIKRYVRSLRDLDYYKTRSPERLERIKKEHNEYKERIKFYIELGSDPMHLNKKGNDYKEILKIHWNDTFLKENNIYAQVEALIFPNRKKKFNWKFWEK